MHIFIMSIYILFSFLIEFFFCCCSSSCSPDYELDFLCSYFEMKETIPSIYLFYLFFCFLLVMALRAMSTFITGFVSKCIPSRPPLPMHYKHNILILLCTYNRKVLVVFGSMASERADAECPMCTTPIATRETNLGCFMNFKSCVLHLCCTGSVCIKRLLILKSLR